MLRIAIVEDEIIDLIGVIRNLMALDRSRYEFEIIPVLLSDPMDDTPEAIEGKAENAKKRLRQHNIDISSWPTVKQMGKLCPVDKKDSSEILQYLSDQNVNIIITDSWIGKDTLAYSEFSYKDLEIAGVMLLDSAEKENQWQGKCWMMTKYKTDVLEKLFEIGGWRPEVFNPLHRYIDKKRILSTTPKVCDSQLERVIVEGIAQLRMTEPTELPEKVFQEGRLGPLLDCCVLNYPTRL